MASFPPTGSRAGFRRRGAIVIVEILAVLTAVSAVLVLFDVDRSVAFRFYDPGRGWPIGRQALWMWLYRYGTVPGLLLTLAALLGFVLSYRTRWLQPWRRELLVVFLTAVIGGGVLVNALFKPYWGRPRPRQVTSFGGQYDYRPFYRPGTPGKGQSFPCGHCTMGYVFVSLLALRRRAPGAAIAGAVFGLGYGSLLGVCRIVQGAHFVTDVLWSLGIVALVAASLYYFFLPDPERMQAAPGRQRFVAAVGTLALIGIVLLFLTRRPFFETHLEKAAAGPEVRRVQIVVEGPMESSKIRFDDKPSVRLRVQARGFGWSLSKVGFKIERRRRNGTLLILLKTERKGYFAEFTQQVAVTAPARLKDRLSLRELEK